MTQRFLPYRGIALKISATLAFALMNAIIKLLSEYPIGEIVFARSFFALIPVLIVASHGGDLARKLATRRPHVHIVRSLVGTSAMFCYFMSILNLPLADSTAYSFVMPIFSVILAAVMLGEAVGPYRWAAVAAGFGGVLLMIEPHGGIASLATGGLSIGAGFGLFGALLAAFVVVFIRQMSATENSEAIVFYFMVTSAVLSGITMAVDFRLPDGLGLLLLILCGVFGGIGQLCMTFSYRYAEPSLLAPFDYVAIVWASTLGFLIFSEVPTIEVVGGCAIVIAAGALITWRERVRGQQKAKVQPL
ncbi:MAG: DMT family transporter [Alphaproteobacteria bacterium]|nr:DMT family transporter [Alphaproteobacteria bacterium]